MDSNYIGYGHFPDINYTEEERGVAKHRLDSLGPVLTGINSEDERLWINYSPEF